MFNKFYIKIEKYNYNFELFISHIIKTLIKIIKFKFKI